MFFYDLAQRFAALFGIHAVKLSKQPGPTVIGLAGRPIDLIIDVGANSGQFAKAMRRIFPRARIISFEPLPGPFAALAKWATADGNATALNLGLGAADGQLPIHLHLDHTPSSSLLAAHETGLVTFPQMSRQTIIDVPIRRLDDVLAASGCTAGPNTLLKLDVQGFEEHVLRGAPTTLTRVGALITEVNIDPLYQDQAEFAALCALAYAGGLRYAGNYAQYPAPDGHVIFLDALFLR